MIKVLHLLLVTSLLILISCEAKEKSTISGYLSQDLEVSILNEFIDEQMDSLGIPGMSLAIINDSKVVYHTARGVKNRLTGEKVDDNTIFESASITKPVFAYFALKMAEKGVFDLDRPLYFYKPEEDLAIDPRYKNVTARQVLSHNTGFPNWRWFSEIPDSIKINRGDFFMLQNPGDGFTYSGEAYHYLARVIAKNMNINMRELANLFQKEVGQPLRMKHAYFVWDDHLYHNKAFGHKGDKIKREWGSSLPSHNSQVFSPAGGLHTEALTYSQFLISLMNREGLYKSTFTDFFSDHNTIPEDHSFAIEDQITAWGLGIAKAETPTGIIYRHGGNNSDFQSEFVIDLENKFGYVFFVNCDQGKPFKRAFERLLGLRE